MRRVFSARLLPEHVRLSACLLWRRLLHFHFQAMAIGVAIIDPLMAITVGLEAAQHRRVYHRRHF